MSFQVEVDQYRGPLDLLLHLVRRHEVEVAEVPLAVVVRQFLEEMQRHPASVDDVGEFLEIAGLLVEMKSRSLLPGDEEDNEAPLDDPREDLVRRLLEYKQFRDAAARLEEQARAWRQTYSRVAPAPKSRRDLSSESLREPEMWDLVTAYSRLSQSAEEETAESIVYDEIPTPTLMERFQEQLAASGKVNVSDAFRAAPHRKRIVGLFSAALELVRRKEARAEQSRLFGDVWLLPFVQDAGKQAAS